MIMFYLIKIKCNVIQEVLKQFLKLVPCSFTVFKKIHIILRSKNAQALFCLTVCNFSPLFLNHEQYLSLKV